MLLKDEVANGQDIAAAGRPTKAYCQCRLQVNTARTLAPTYPHRSSSGSSRQHLFFLIFPWLATIHNYKPISEELPSFQLLLTIHKNSLQRSAFK